MNKSACCDTQFLNKTYPDANLLETFTALLIRASRAGCALLVDSSWVNAFDVAGGVLHYPSKSVNKELRDRLLRQLGAMTPSESPTCDARATQSELLLLLPEGRPIEDIKCDGDQIAVSLASSLGDFQEFWRDLLRRF